jgi:hypothetical protein
MSSRINYPLCTLNREYSRSVAHLNRSRPESRNIDSRFAVLARRNDEARTLLPARRWCIRYQKTLPGRCRKLAGFPDSRQVPTSVDRVWHRRREQLCRQTGKTISSGWRRVQSSSFSAYLLAFRYLVDQFSLDYLSISLTINSVSLSSLSGETICPRPSSLVCVSAKRKSVGRYAMDKSGRYKIVTGVPVGVRL